MDFQVGSVEPSSIMVFKLIRERIL